MNFSFDSVKLKSKRQNEDFYLDIETARGHFFAVLDFTSHDYANLNPSLKGKLESIVGSFASLSNFSDELFLGFLAKEINNFVSNLAAQSGGPELLFSAALCLLSGNRLSYFLCGNIRIILSSDGLTSPQAAASPEQLGASNLEAPMKDQIRALTLHDDDLVLIMTQGLAEVLPADVASLRESDPKAICVRLMKSSLAGSEDRTLVVIGGPYSRHVEEALPDVSELADFKQSLAALEARLDALTGAEQLTKVDVGGLTSGHAAELEQKLNPQIESLKDDLRSKASSLDLLEFDEKLRAQTALLAGKADRSEVLGLQRDVLKLGLASNSLGSADASQPDNLGISPASPQADAGVTGSGSESAQSLQPKPGPTSFTLKTALIVVAISLAAGFVGGWLHPGETKRPEVWSVKTSENQIVISRLDGPAREDVTMNVLAPVKSTGEQTFSSFTDVKQYIDTITTTEVPSAQTSPANSASPIGQATPSPESKPVGAANQITIKPGDTLQRLSQAYRVSPERLKELNPAITRWPAIRIGQKIFVPAAGQTSRTSVLPPAEQLPTQAPASVTPANTSPANTSPANTSPADASPADTAPAKTTPANTTEVTVGPGDSLNRLARRSNTTPERLKELNPKITNWLRLQMRQKVIVPTRAGG